MNPVLNREASQARAAELRRQAGHDAIALADLRAGHAASANPPASKIATMMRLLRPHWIRRTLPGVIAGDIADRAQSR